MEGVIKTSDASVDTARKIRSLRDKHLEKVASLGKSSEKGILLLNALCKTPIVRIKDVEKVCSLSNPNALILVEKFEKAKILIELTGKKRNRLFSYQDYISLFA